MSEATAELVEHPCAEGVSVIVPAFNLEASIATTIACLLEELAPLAPALELIVVDDGSTDGTAHVVRRLSATVPSLRLLRNRRNLGKGMTVYLGLLAARYSKGCFVDGDLPFSPGSAAAVLAPVLRGRAFCVASRRLPDSELLVRMDVLRYVARRHLVGVAFNSIVRLILGLPFRDTQCGLKSFDRRVGLDLFQRLHSLRFLFDVELFLAARALQVSVDEVPVRVTCNDLKSSVRIVASAAHTLWELGVIAVRDRSGRYRRPNPAMAAEVVCGLAEEASPARIRVTAATDFATAPAAGVPWQRASG